MDFLPERKRARGSFLDEWLNKKQPRPLDLDKLKRNTIKHDKWDEQDYNRMLEEMIDFDHERDLFCDEVQETGNGAWGDAYYSLMKVTPHLEQQQNVRPKYLVNHRVMEEALDLREWEEVRALGTIGDDVAAAMGTVALREDLESLFKKLEDEQEQAKEIEEGFGELGGLQGEEADIEGMIESLEESGEETDAQGRGPIDYQQMLEENRKAQEELREKLRDQVQNLQENLDKKAGGIRADLKQAADKAADEAQAQLGAADAWGMEPGALQRLPHDQRIALAQRLNNPRLKKIAELFGPMKRLMFTEQRRRVTHANEEVYDLETGADLSRVLPVEFAKLTHPLRKFEFYKDFAERRLPQYKMRGEEKVGKGPIIYCEDGSGSMGGDRELWAKALGLCLLHLARKEKRRFRAIHFGSAYQIWEADFSKPEDFTTEKILDFAEFFFGGGTDFVTPLSRATDLITEEFEKEGKAESDVVFATDGACGVPQDWLEKFCQERDRMAFTVWGVTIGGHPQDEPLNTICDGKVCMVSDLKGGEDVRDVFAGVGHAQKKRKTIQ